MIMNTCYLPSQAVDMFGCGLPICVASYSCIEELVKVERNGLLLVSLLFHTASAVAASPFGDNVQEILIDPTIKGTVNVLRSRVKARVQRVVLTSSSSATRYRDDVQQICPLNEFCWSNIDYCKRYKVKQNATFFCWIAFEFSQSSSFLRTRIMYAVFMCVRRFLVVVCVLKDASKGSICQLILVDIVNA